MTFKGQNGEPWVVAAWLRDYLLLPNERKDPFLWKKVCPCLLVSFFFFLLLLLEEVSMHAQTKLLLQVEELVQEDSRVDQYPKLLKGEQKVVWEWQGLGCCLIL